MPHIGHAAIRNRGTIGGSVAFADPAAELPACLLALGGEVEIAGATGKRTVKADDFFKGLFETALGADEILTAIRVPAARERLARRLRRIRPPPRRLCHRGSGSERGKASGKGLSEVRLVFFGVGATPVRAKSAERALVNGDIEAAVQSLGSDLAPHDDVQADAATKMHLAGVLLRRVAKQLSEARS